MPWHFHDNSVDSWAEPSSVDRMTKEWLNRDIRSMTVEEFAYWGGLLQSEALREYIESFRRKMFSSSCACFWMFNDCWPTTRSWTIIDHNLRRTPSFHPVKRSFAPVHVVVACQDNEIRIYGINETQFRLTAQLRFGAFNLSGSYLIDSEQEATLPPNSSTVLASFSAATLEQNVAAFAVLEVDEKLVTRNRLFVRKFLEMEWSVSPVKVEVKDGTASFSSDVFTWAVCLDLIGETPLSDNFFDLYPGMTYTIPWPHTEPPRILYTGNPPAQSAP